MIRFTFILVLAINLVNGFVVDQGAGARNRDTSRASVATTVSRPRVEPAEEPAITTITQPAMGKPKITSLEDTEDYKNFLKEDDRLCMVKFYAPHCKACQKFGMQFKRIGKEIGDLSSRNKDGSETVVREGEIRLAEMEYGANKELCKSLGITKLPSVHFYAKGKLVDGFPCGPSKIGMLLGKLARFRSMSPVELEFEVEMNQGMALGDSVLETLNIEIVGAEQHRKKTTSLPKC